MALVLDAAQVLIVKDHFSRASFGVLSAWEKTKPWKDMEEKRAMCFQDCSLSKLSVKVLK